MGASSPTRHGPRSRPRQLHLPRPTAIGPAPTVSSPSPAVSHAPAVSSQVPVPFAPCPCRPGRLGVTRGRQSTRGHANALVVALVLVASVSAIYGTLWNSLSTLLPPRAQLSSKLRMPFRLGRATRHRSGRSGELQPPTTPSRSAHQPKEQKPPLNLRNPLPRSRAHAFFLGSGRIRLHRRRSLSGDSLSNSFSWEHPLISLYLSPPLTHSRFLPRSLPPLDLPAPPPAHVAGSPRPLPVLGDHSGKLPTPHGCSCSS